MTRHFDKMRGTANRKAIPNSTLCKGLSEVSDDALILPVFWACVSISGVRKAPSVAKRNNTRTNIHVSNRAAMDTNDDPGHPESVMGDGLVMCAAKLQSSFRRP